MDIESENNDDIDEEGYSSFSELDEDSESETENQPTNSVTQKTLKDVFQEEATAFDDEDNVETEINRLNKKKSNVVTRNYPNLLPLSKNAKDPIELNWQKRPTRMPTQLPAHAKKGSRFISFTPSTSPEDMFLRFWEEPSDVILKGINERSKEVFEKVPRTKNPETYSKEDLLAFVAAWLLMDCTPFRQRRQFWNKFK